MPGSVGLPRHRAREKDRKFTLMVVTEAIRNNPMMEKYKDDMIEDLWIDGKLK